MIFTLLRLFKRWILLLIVPPAVPPAGMLYQDGRLVMDQDAPCMACGHRGGTLAFVADEALARVKHTCAVCGAKRFAKTVYEAVTGNKPELSA